MTEKPDNQQLGQLMGQLKPDLSTGQSFSGTTWVVYAMYGDGSGKPAFMGWYTSKEHAEAFQQRVFECDPSKTLYVAEVPRGLL